MKILVEVAVAGITGGIFGGVTFALVNGGVIPAMIAGSLAAAWTLQKLWTAICTRDRVIAGQKGESGAVFFDCVRGVAVRWVWGLLCLRRRLRVLRRLQSLGLRWRRQLQFVPALLVA